LHFTTTWLPNGLFGLGALGILGGLIGFGTDTSGDQARAIGLGVVLLVVGFGLRAVGQRSRDD